jgi:hypothetical protein
MKTERKQAYLAMCRANSLAGLHHEAKQSRTTTLFCSRAALRSASLLIEHWLVVRYSTFDLGRQFIIYRAH